MRFHVEREVTASRWTRWIQPVMSKYLMACCDCGLVHEMQFRVVGTRVRRVQFRARRSKGHTKQRRRAKP